MFTITEDAHIVPVRSRLNQRRNHFEDLLLLRVLIENVIERKIFLQRLSCPGRHLVADDLQRVFIDFHAAQGFSVLDA